MDREKRILVVEATADNITKVTAFANACMEQWGCPEIFQAQMDIAIDEVFGNIVRYAYPLQTGSAAVQVEVEGEPLTVIITFMDQGYPSIPWPGRRRICLWEQKNGLWAGWEFIW